MKTMILAEKPSQAQDIAKGLQDNFQRSDGYLEGSKYVITWAFGHLCELYEPELYDEKYKKWSIEDLPIIPDRFEYRVTKDGLKQFKVIKSLVQRQDIEKIIIATDPGREGELIARLILKLAGSNKPIYRFWTSNALTYEAVRDAMSQLRDSKEFDNLYQSALARQHADWLVGINCTRAITARLGELFSVGRVQTAVLKLICDREKEIENFSPRDYWNIKAVFKAEKGEYKGIWVKVAETEDKEGEEITSPSAIYDEDTAKQIEKEIQELGTGTIESVKEQIKSEKPPLLFSLTTLQQDANRAFSFSADKTLQIAQALYEKKALTYPRTESNYLNEEMETERLKILQNLTTVKFDMGKCSVTKTNKRIFDSSKLTDHHAIIPTSLIPQNLTDDELKIYDLVVKRFIAAFYPDYQYKQTTILTIVNNHHFKTTGRAIAALGWKEIYGSAKEQDVILPSELKEGEMVKIVKNTEIIKKQTTPPSRYTDATILQDMTNAHKFIVCRLSIHLTPFPQIELPPC